MYSSLKQIQIFWPFQKQGLKIEFLIQILHKRLSELSGGVAIDVKSCFSVSSLHAVTVPKCFEFIALKINIGPNNSIVVVGIYGPPSPDARSDVSVILWSCSPGIPAPK